MVSDPTTGGRGSVRRRSFDDRDGRALAALGRLVADLVAPGAGAVRRPVDDTEASRLVNQAVGVLITHSCTEEQALRRLAAISSSTGMAVAEAARLIVEEAAVEARFRLVERPARARVRSFNAWAPAAADRR